MSLPASSATITTDMDMDLKPRVEPPLTEPPTKREIESFKIIRKSGYGSRYRVYAVYVGGGQRLEGLTLTLWGARRLMRKEAERVRESLREEQVVEVEKV
jgi:hypothetical protein